MHHDLGIDTLEELEVAAHEGRLTQLPGIGDKRLSGIIARLAERLGKVRRKIRPTENTVPSIPTHQTWKPSPYRFILEYRPSSQESKTHDWVVLYDDDGQKHSQCTVITAEWGILEGRRIVSGRESQCLMYYEEQESKAPGLPLS